MVLVKWCVLIAACVYILLVAGCVPSPEEECVKMCGRTYVLSYRPEQCVCAPACDTVPR